MFNNIKYFLIYLNGKFFAYSLLPVKKAKLTARWGRKATGLFMEEKIAGLPGKAIRFCVFPEDDTMAKKPPPLNKSAWLLVFSYVKYFANDPTF